MLQLVDYGSESDEDTVDDQQPISAVVVSQTKPNATQKALVKPTGSFFDPEDSFDVDDDSGLDDLRSAVGRRDKDNVPEEAELEDFLKSRKDWEKKLAEAARKKKEKKKSRKINAFGALGALPDSKSGTSDMEIGEEEQTDSQQQARREPTSNFGLLAMLPPPKTNTKFAAKAKPASVLLPSALQKKPTVGTSASSRNMGGPAAPDVPVKRARVANDSDEEDGDMDFFGLKKTEAPVSAQDPSIAVSAAPNIFMDDAPEISYPTLSDATAEAHQGSITDEAARKLIYERELAPWGANSMIATDAVHSMVDVSVDSALGPNIKATLLRNLNQKVMAQVATGPLPTVKKDPRDRLAKRKHQITHLAGMAVAREEQLQEQWAENRQKKKASAQKYGF
ncbi:Protein C39E9.11 [Aphelenchoides avenae]|nr:Protein C39E9.11 [Aphelenchus avenae]